MKKQGFKLALALIMLVSVFVMSLPTVVSAASKGTVTATMLNMRKGPGTSHATITSLKKGTEVEILDKEGNWLYVSASGKKGYVSATYIKTSSSTSTSSSSSVTINTGVTLRSGSTGSNVTALQKALKTLGYFSGTATGTYGSVTENAVEKFQKDNGLSVDGVAGPKTLTKVKSKLNGDSSSSSSSSSSSAAVTGRTDVTLKMGSSGTEVTNLQKALKNKGYMSASATGYYGSATRQAVIAFQKANKLTADGVAGKKTLTALYGTSSSSSTSSSSTKTYSTMRQGQSSSNVKDLQNALKKKGYFSAEATGYYGTLTVQAVKAFQKANSLSADGVAGPKTLAKLGFAVSSGSSAADKINKNGKIEMADWWTVVNKAFARGEKAVVTDVKTGLSYEVYRHGGTNHADVEPVTAEDTAIMKKIYGGSWSWNRRAVWVSVGDRNFAASINGMPHGGESLSYNNFNGHSCIHFLNSRTHGTNKVDSAHQNAVKEAFNKADQFKK